MRAIVLSLAAMLAFAVPATAATYPTGFEEREIVAGLDRPMAAAWAPDGRMFVVEKERAEGGQPGSSAAIPIADYAQKVNSHHDRGLLGVAVDGQYSATNPFLYLLYTYDLNQTIPDSEGPMVSQLMRVSVDADNVVSEPTVILGTHTSGVCPTPANNVDCMPSDGLSHSIGTVRSAPDGTVWLGSGDAASFSEVDRTALRTYDERSLAGKIIHVDRFGRGIGGHLLPGRREPGERVHQAPRQGVSQPVPLLAASRRGPRGGRRRLGPEGGGPRSGGRRAELRLACTRAPSGRRATATSRSVKPSTTGRPGPTWGQRSTTSATARAR